MASSHASYLKDNSGFKKFIKNARTIVTNKYIVLSDEAIELFKYNGATKIVNGSILVSDFIEFLWKLSENQSRLLPIASLIHWSHYEMGFDFENEKYLAIINLLGYDRNAFFTYHGGFEMPYIKVVSITNLLKCFSKKDRKLAKEYVFKISIGQVTHQEIFNLYVSVLVDYAKDCGNDSLLRTINALNRVYMSGNSGYALENIQKLTYLLFSVGIEFGKSSSIAWFDCFNNQVNLDDKNYADTIVLHELGHCLDHNLGFMPQNFEEVLIRARNTAYNWPMKTGRFLENLQTENFFNNKTAFHQAEQYVSAVHGSVLNLKNKIFYYLQGILCNNPLNIAVEIIFKAYDLDDATKFSINNLFSSENVDYNILTDIIYNSIIKTYADFFFHTNLRTYFSDMITNIFEGENFSFYYKNFHINGHTNQYYLERGNGAGAFVELMANYNVLKLYNCENMINELRSIFGNELFDVLENCYRSQNEYNNVPGVGTRVL